MQHDPDFAMITYPLPNHLYGNNILFSLSHILYQKMLM